jgi:two-component system, OmpR family, phosphate regulon sensor histidine kinase PhoR
MANDATILDHWPLIIHHCYQMPDALYILCLLFMALLAGVLFNLFRTQRAALRRMLDIISQLAAGDHSRRTDPGVPGAAGQVARAINALADEQEQRSLRAQEDKDHLVSLLALLDHTNEIALATDNMDCIRLVNPAAARVLDRPVDQLLGKHVDHVLHQPELLALYRQAFSSNRPVSAQIALAAGERTLHCQATVATIYNGPHYRGTLLLMRDITEVARTLQMKTDFVANASHELRTPLASIRAAVETIKDAGPEDPETARRCIDIINNHALRLQLLVQDLLDLSRTEDPRASIRHDRLDLQQVCDMVMGMYSSQAADKHLQLLVELDGQARALRGDERLLMLSLKNLVDNALKFTAQGSVTIRSYVRSGQLLVASGPNGSPLDPPDPQPLTTDHSPTDHSSVIVEVVDTGCGIPPEDRQRVFERFYTVNRSRGGADRGTGLGLAIVKHAVAAMGGQVELESELNQGTTVRCVFPIPPAAEEA